MKLVKGMVLGVASVYVKCDLYQRQESWRKKVYWLYAECAVNLALLQVYMQGLE